ncbi:helicase associated domain-containing protein [Streptomyces sp. TLI_146]|uniref:helicase associated domain-containing protein n=1 Tax=Streptomyces sp. TLI_146 TaxID=1938858 RepID=UPI000CC38315|nr:helicase associated domain-containing protein [Streptomyces sp. TLI_146]PKV82579.1 helicase associated protein [Streptomyces sp. TLI_146]
MGGRGGVRSLHGAAILPEPRRAGLGLAAAIRYHKEHHHLRVPTDFEDAYGYRLGAFITGPGTAYNQGALDPDWTTELEDLGMVWDDHEAAWQANLTVLEAFHTEHGHLAIPTTAPGGQFLVVQRGLARNNALPTDRAAQPTALDPDWLLPHGSDWHHKYHLLRRHIEAGNDPTTLRRDTLLDGVKAGSWLHRQFTTWNDLDPGQRDLLTHLGLTPDRVPLRRSASPPLLRTQRGAAAGLRGAERPSARRPGVDRGGRRTDHDRPMVVQNPHEARRRAAHRGAAQAC